MVRWDRLEPPRSSRGFCMFDGRIEEQEEDSWIHNVFVSRSPRLTFSQSASQQCGRADSRLKLTGAAGLPFCLCCCCFWLPRLFTIDDFSWCWRVIRWWIVRGRVYGKVVAAGVFLMGIPIGNACRGCVLLSKKIGIHHFSCKQLCASPPFQDPHCSNFTNSFLFFSPDFWTHFQSSRVLFCSH